MNLTNIVYPEHSKNDGDVAKPSVYHGFLLSRHEHHHMAERHIDSDQPLWAGQSQRFAGRSLPEDRLKLLWIGIELGDDLIVATHDQHRFRLGA